MLISSTETEDALVDISQPITFSTMIWLLARLWMENMPVSLIAMVIVLKMENGSN
jgi:hypothetical protein